MNYEKIHNDLVQYMKQTTPKEREIKRGAKFINYTERHHIIPTSQGGSDEEENIIDCTLREHALLHLLRYYIYGNRRDINGFRFVVNGATKRKNRQIIDDRQLVGLKHLLSIQTNRVKRNGGWHSPEGIDSISKSRKGMVVVKDKEGNKQSVDCKDERVLNGELVHHTTGELTVINKIDGSKQRIKSKDYDRNIHDVTNDQSGYKNGNSFKITNEEILEHWIRLSKLFGYVFNCRRLAVELSIEGIKIPGTPSPFRPYEEMMKEVIKSTGLKYIDSRKHLCTNKYTTRPQTRKIKEVSIGNSGKMDVYDITVEKTNNFYANDILIHNCQEIVQVSTPAKFVKEVAITEDGDTTYHTIFKDEEIALCNLASYNLKIFLPEVREKLPEMIGTDLEGLIYAIYRVMDNTIDISDYPRASAKQTNLDNRYLGLGVSNTSYFLAKSKMKWTDPKSEVLIYKTFQELNYLITKANIRMAKEFGPCKAYRGSEWSNGNVVYDLGNQIIKDKYKEHFREDWYNELKHGVRTHGVHNILTQALAPVASCMVRDTKIKVYK